MFVLLLVLVAFVLHVLPVIRVVPVLLVVLVLLVVCRLVVGKTSLHRGELPTVEEYQQFVLRHQYGALQAIYLMS